MKYMTFWKIKIIQHSEKDKQEGKENQNTPAVFAKA